jgi:hypothetical protein
VVNLLLTLRLRNLPGLDASMLSILKSSFSPSKKPANVEDNDCRKRNRLSKPPTNTSSLNLSSLSLLQPGNRSTTLVTLSKSTEELRDQPQLNPIDEPRDLLKARLFGPDSEGLQECPQIDTTGWKGTAFVLSELETQQPTSPTTKSPVTSPLSAIFNTSRLSLISSKEYKDVQERTPPKTDLRSSNPSREDLTSPIPIRRRSLLQPGVATRIKKDVSWGPSPAGTVGADADRDYYYNPVIPEEASRSELEALNLETPKARKLVPPPLVRTETPSDLVFLGGLKLGTLHVTNGCASPAPSELSRRVKSRSTPNLRTASSEYGDSDHEECDTDAGGVVREGTPKSLHVPEVPPRFISQAPRYQSPLRFSSDSPLPRINTICGDVNQSLQAGEESKDTTAANRSPDRSTSMAEDYMAELPASPFGVTRSSSTSQSILNPTTKCTEFDDQLFENDSVTPSDHESVANSAVDTFGSSNDAETAQGKAEPSPQQLRPAYILVDSGYSSNSSLRKDSQDEIAADGSQARTLQPKTAETTHTEVTVPKERQHRRPGPRPLRPSILKQAGAATTSLPNFENLHQSSTTVSTIMTTASAPPMQKSKKLMKSRLLSRSARKKEITVQGNHEVFSGSIPPIPAEFEANLAIRSQQVPELEHTFESRFHTAESPATSPVEFGEIRFPSPAGSVDRSNESPAPPPPLSHRRASLHRRSRSGRRSSAQYGSQELSKADALAVIQDFGTVGHSLGGNPYDVARTSFPSGPRRNPEPSRKVNPHNVTSAAKRPKSLGGMDAQTAAELARMRSRTIYERDALTLAEKRDQFNDRGGVPGKNLRPMSFTASTPPLPPLPAGFETDQRRSWAPHTTRPQMQRPSSWIPEYDHHASHSSADIRPSHDHAGYETQHRWTSYHDQRNPEYLEHYGAEYYPDTVERQQSWRSDRVEVDFDPSRNWTPAYEQGDFDYGYDEKAHHEYIESWSGWQATPYEDHQWNRDKEEEEEAPPPPPPPHSPRPMSIAPSEEDGNAWTSYGQAWQERRQSAGEALRHASDSRQSDNTQGLYPAIPPRNPPSNQAYHGPYVQPSDYDHQYWEGDRIAHQTSYDSHHSQSNSRRHSRPHSQANSYNGSYAGSLAESLHPPYDPPRISPSPQFGRYSGGFSYGYEQGSGFGGSAGTRSVSGVAGASRKGKELSEGYGVDLSDVPIIAGLKRL